jgi:protocatechuate 3,4-dioxygenase beta subunit
MCVFLQVATTDATGVYTIKTVPGTYNIEAKKEVASPTVYASTLIF